MGVARIIRGGYCGGYMEMGVVGSSRTGQTFYKGAWV